MLRNLISVMLVSWLCCNSAPGKTAQEQSSKNPVNNHGVLEFRALWATYNSPQHISTTTRRFVTDGPLSDHDQWNKNLSQWRSEDYNAIIILGNPNEFWTGEHYLLRLEKFPEARELPPEQIEKNISDMKWLFRRAKELGLQNFLYTLSIHWTPAFSRKHNLDHPMPESDTVSWYHNQKQLYYRERPAYNCGIRNPLTTAYSNAIWEEFCQTYEDLDGFYSPIAEAVPGPRGTFFQQAIIPGVKRSGRHPIIIAHNWQATIEDFVKNIAPKEVYDNTWFGYHAYNEEQIVDAEPNPRIIEWAAKAQLPTVVSVYPANVECFPFNSPKFAADIITEMKKIPYIKGFMYWEHSGRMLSPLFRKALGYYAAHPEPYSDKPWIALLQEKFGTREAAEHLLKAYNISGRIMAEKDALIYTGGDGVSTEKELNFPYSIIAGPPGDTTSPAPSRKLISIHQYAQLVADNPNYSKTAQNTPPVQMSMVRSMGRQCFDEANQAMDHVTKNKREAQQALTWMKAYQLITTYFDLKVAAATSALIYKHGRRPEDKRQALDLAQQAYDSYLVAADYMLAHCAPILRELYGITMKTPNGPEIPAMKKAELQDKRTIDLIFAWNHTN